MTDQRRKLKRASLYDLVWTTPISKLAKDFGLSDVGFSKICRKHQIPLPPRGHWAKVASGQRIRKSPLPNPQNDPDIEIVRRDPDSNLQRLALKTSQERRQLAETEVGEITIPEELSRPHPLTKKTQQFFGDILKKKQREQKLKNPWKLNWEDRAPLNEYGRYRSYPPEGYSLVVSFDCLNRALVFLDTLVKSLEKHGFEIQEDIKPQQRPKRKIIAVKDDEGISFYLVEGYKRRLLTPEEYKSALEESSFAKSYELVPSGKLTLTTSSIEFWNERKWTDGGKPIEHVLPEIVAEFLRLVTRQKQQRVEREEERRRQAERARIDAEIRTRRELKIKEYESTFSEAMKYFELKRLEEYLNQIEYEYKVKYGELGGNVLDWFRMMREMMEKRNPLPQRVQYLSDLGARPLEDHGWRDPP